MSESKTFMNAYEAADALRPYLGDEIADRLAAEPKAHSWLGPEKRYTFSEDGLTTASPFFLLVTLTFGADTPFQRKTLKMIGDKQGRRAIPDDWSKKSLDTFLLGSV